MQTVAVLKSYNRNKFQANNIHGVSQKKTGPQHNFINSQHLLTVSVQIDIIQFSVDYISTFSARPKTV